MAKNSPFSGWQILFTRSMLIPFVFGAIILSIVSKAVYDLLITFVGKDAKAILSIGLGALALMFIFVYFLNKFLYHWRRASPLAGKKQPEKRKGLIILVSNEDVCRKAIDWHKEILSRCWFICTERSLSIADNLKAQYENNSTLCQNVVIADQDVYDPMIFKRKIEEIYRNLPEYFVEEDIILDFTGLTSIASVGAVLGCLTEGRSLQYVPGVFDKGLNVIKPLDPIEIELDWEEIN